MVVSPLGNGMFLKNIGPVNRTGNKSIIVAPKNWALSACKMTNPSISSMGSIGDAQKMNL